MVREVIPDLTNQIELLVVDLVDQAERRGNKGSLREGGDGSSRSEEFLDVLSTDMREAVMLQELPQSVLHKTSSEYGSAAIRLGVQ